MPTTRANDIELCYETFGSQDDPTLMLIMGLGAQMIAWPEAFCQALAAKGFFVTRHDNRDVGLSTKFDDVEVGSAEQARSGLGSPAYSLEDMADDAIALLDAIGRPDAHVVGASMGGMIAQAVAIRAPEKVLSLTSIMSAPGGTDSIPPTPEALEMLLMPRPESREEIMALSVKTRHVIGGKGFPIDEAAVREAAGLAYDRCYNPKGMLRQMAAIGAAGSRVEALGALTMPVLVVHGLDDTLVPPANGQRTADAIPGAELLEIDGMGHDLPEGAWPQIIDGIVAIAAKAAVAR